MSQNRRFILISLIAATALLLALCSWVWWGDWPKPPSYRQVTDPAILVVLGGGDQARSHEAVRLAAAFPQVPVLVTGDSGFITSQLASSGITPPRLHVEHHATSTWENAQFSKPWVDSAKDGQLVIITNDFHVSRSLAVFRKVYPDRDIVASCEFTTAPYSQWQKAFRRRERAAALYYALRFGVWSW